MKLEELLQRSADAVPVETPPIEAIRRRATRIRRRRAAWAAGGAAAAVAVVGVGYGVVGHHTAASGPISNGGLPSANASPVVPPTTVQFSPNDADLSYGGEPGVGYWTDGQLVAPDGSTFDAADLPGTFVYDPTTFLPDCTDQGACPAIGTTGWATGDAGSMAVTADGKTFAHVDNAGAKTNGAAQWQISIQHSGSDVKTFVYPSSRMTEPKSITVAGILPDDNVVLNVTGPDWSSTVQILHTDTGQADPTTSGQIDEASVQRLGTQSAGYARAGSVSSTGLIAVESHASGQAVPLPGLCWSLIDESAVVHGTFCGPTDVEFSADGKYIAGPVARVVASSEPSDQGRLDKESLAIAITSSFEVVDTATSEATAIYQFEPTTLKLFSDRFGWDGDQVIVPAADGVTLTESGTASPTLDDTVQVTWELIWLGPDGSYRVGRASQKPGTAVTPAYAFGAGPVDSAH